MSLKINKDILFDYYGDIRFNYGDIITIEDKSDIFYQNILHRLISKFNDYKTAPDLGADIQSLIGRPINKDLETNIKHRIIYVMTFDRFLDKREIDVLTLPQIDKIYIRLNIYIDGNKGLLASERITINSIFNAKSGLLYATI